MKLGKEGEAYFVHETEETWVPEEASPIMSPKNSLKPDLSKIEQDALSFDENLSNSSDEENKLDEPEVELHYSDIQDKSSEEVLKYLKEKLHIEEGENQLLKEAIETGNSK